MAGVKIDGLEKKFGNLKVLKGIDLDIHDGEFVSFLGPSGCGKTTLLRSIAGLEEINAGEVVLGEQAISKLQPAKRDIAMVFQNYALYPHMNVYKNLSFGLSLNGFAKTEIDERVQNAARILQITDLLKRRPNNCRVDSVSGSPLVVRLCATRSSSCLTSRFPILMPVCA